MVSNETSSRINIVFFRPQGKGRLCDAVCDKADAPASFESDVTKHFGFSISRNEK